jgi:hypothetical protein
MFIGVKGLDTIIPNGIGFVKKHDFSYPNSLYIPSEYHNAYHGCFEFLLVNRSRPANSLVTEILLIE